MVEFLWAVVGLHCGRVQFRRKQMKHSGVQLSNVFGRKNAKRCFSDDIVCVRLSCDPDNIRGGFRIEGADSTGFQYSFTESNIVPYGAVSNIYVSSTDFRDDMEKLAEWSKYFQILASDTLTNDFVDLVQSFIIMTKDLQCFLFFLNERRGSLQTSIRKILQTLLMNRNTESKLSTIAKIQSIRYLDQNNLNDGALLCPFNNEGEWAAEVSSCVADNVGRFTGFVLEIRRNPTWSGHLSQYYVVPKLFPSTLWLHTHCNGSMLFSADRSSESLRTNSKVFDLDSLLWDPIVPHQTCLNLARQIGTDHYKDWLASSALFWSTEGEFASKWLKFVSNILQVVHSVIKAVVSKECQPVLLVSCRRSLCLIVAALAQLCLSSKSRASIKSINRLIQKYFVSLGFPFRLGNSGQPDYLFFIFIDCFYQLLSQNPMDFGITAEYLKTLAVSFVSDYFFEFSFSSPSKRVDACRRNCNSYRWFFPIEQNFSQEDFSRFINQAFYPQPIMPKMKPTIATTRVDPPISYYPFNLAAEKQENRKSNKPSSSGLVRWLSNGHLADDSAENDVASVKSHNRASLASRMRDLAPKNLFGQRPKQTLVIYQPLILRKAAVDQPLSSPFSYFSAETGCCSKTAPVIFPRYHQPCLRFWSDFFLAHEYDFQSFEESNNSSGVQV